ncbi:hypothetical protein AVEN_249936-1 [Araneus ventricosus]|uniref:Histone-lysine N-methyltransferase SETMAR n=1 Tax=Araneus ventricosus TaxID=182803 RepID=A0A4Y2DXA2_ARAVE|nr:hypothetical protein AVEN_249936-1 [Araneus ventricosus]
MQKWFRYDAARNHFEREGEAFLRCIIVLNKTWATTTETPIERMASLRVTTKIESSPEPQQCESYALRKKRRHFLHNPPIILQDNARPHVAQAVTDLFDRWGWEVLYHPSYSPELSSRDFDFIPKMKEPLRGRTVPEILQAVDRSVRTINTTGAAKGILQLPHL